MIGRPAAVCGQINYVQLRFAFWGSSTLSTSTHRHLPVEIIRFHTIYDDFSDIWNSTTWDLRQQRVYRGPFISEDGNFDLNCTISCYYVARKVDTSANSALIRYYLPRLKLSSSTLALARERTPSIYIVKVTWLPFSFVLPSTFVRFRHPILHVI